MVYRSVFGVLAVATLLATAFGGAQAQDKKYPNWKGEWNTVMPRLPGQQLRFDPNKPYGRGQEAPLTEEYKKIYEANLAEHRHGRSGPVPGSRLVLPGRHADHDVGRNPRIHHHAGNDLHIRRHRSCGASSPTDALGPPTSNRRIRASRSATGSMKTATASMMCSKSRPAAHSRDPASYDATGLPLHFDNDSTFKERIFVDKSNPSILHDMITVFDRALTRPWTVDKTYRHGTKKYPNWSRDNMPGRNELCHDRQGILSA